MEVIKTILLPFGTLMTHDFYSRLFIITNHHVEWIVEVGAFAQKKTSE